MGFLRGMGVLLLAWAIEVPLFFGFGWLGGELGPLFLPYRQGHYGSNLASGEGMMLGAMFGVILASFLVPVLVAKARRRISLNAVVTSGVLHALMFFLVAVPLHTATRAGINAGVLICILLPGVSVVLVTTNLFFPLEDTLSSTSTECP